MSRFHRPNGAAALSRLAPVDGRPRTRIGPAAVPAQAGRHEPADRPEEVRTGLDGPRRPTRPAPLSRLEGRWTHGADGQLEMRWDIADR